jgi:putative peptide-modifying radical SAM enzyme
MNFYVTLTTNCNLRCKYCYEKSCEDFGSDFHGLAIDYSIPSSPTYETGVLRKFLEQDSSDPVLIFYGGEPLLKINRLKETMDAIPNAHFVIQTNGLLLDRIDSDYLNRLDSIFVSLDGDEALTDYYRGRGTYMRVRNNLRNVRERGFQGEIVARMTVAEATEIDTQVLALIDGDEMPISSVHWQLDALFWHNDYPKRRFSEWITQSYNPRLRRLIRTWVDHMRNAGEVWRIYPFVGITHSMLNGESCHLRCGAGWCVFNIQTDGNITPCPVMAGMRDFYLGNIRDASFDRLKDALFVSEPCTSCKAFTICGGRCLYANATKLWGTKGFNQVCGTVINLIEALSDEVHQIKSLLESGRIRQENFEYPKYNGCEIIP